MTSCAKAPKKGLPKVILGVCLCVLEFDSMYKFCPTKDLAPWIFHLISLPPSLVLCHFSNNIVPD